MINKPSAEQQAIFDEFANPDGNFVIDAYAGTGKTTTIVEGGKFSPARSKIYCAFNKRIEEELNSRLMNVNGARSKTIHGLGFGCVRLARPKVTLDKKGLREKWLTTQVAGPVPDDIFKLITKLHTKAREIAPHAREVGDLTDIAYQFELLPDESWSQSGWDLDFVEKKALDAMELAATGPTEATGIDFSDMIFLPVRNHWVRPIADEVLIDEYQDLTSAQLEIAVKSSRGRVIIVGDKFQAIYAFRGADSTSAERLPRELNAKILKLTTTYRCGHAIVEKAQKYVPDFHAGPNNPPGIISTVGWEKLVPMASGGDFVLSRLNAPLVSVAMGLLKQQKRARIAGKDIGWGLKKIIQSLRARTIPEFLAKLATWEEKQVLRFTAAKKESQVELVRDQAETLMALAEDAKSVDQLSLNIDALFTDDGLGQAGVITCSSVHRAKGLEAERVFILKDTLREHNQEERNICYVAITRAKKELVWVNKRLPV